MVLGERGGETPLRYLTILALIAYLKFSIGQIHFGGFAFFAFL